MLSSEAFKTGMDRLAEMWPSRRVEGSLLRSYRVALADLRDEMFLRAVESCLASCRFFPSPGEIRAQLSPSDLNRLALHRVYGPGGKYHHLIANQS